MDGGYCARIVEQMGPLPGPKEKPYPHGTAAPTKEKDMISDEDIKYFASVDAGGAIGEMATELLQRRESERKANSWDDAPAWAVARRRAKGGRIYYPDMAEVKGMGGFWELQERP